MNKKRQTQEILITSRKDTSQWTILIVDDEPDNLKVAERILSFQGATVHIAEDGLKGLEVLESIIPTFILLDISMPNMNGWEMIKAVREDENLPYIPIIALTAHAMQGDQERIMASGFDGYISKPFRLGSFLQQIMDCLTAFTENSTSQSDKADVALNDTKPSNDPVEEANQDES